MPKWMVGWLGGWLAGWMVGSKIKSLDGCMVDGGCLEDWNS